MALDRSWYNALVDDDGSGMTGSVWDKADIKNLLDSIDAELARIQKNRAPWTPTIQTAEGATCSTTQANADWQLLGDELFWRIYLAVNVPTATAHIRVWLPGGYNPVIDNIDETLLRLYVTSSEVGYAVARTWPFLEVHRLVGTFPVGAAYIIGSGFYFIR